MRDIVEKGSNTMSTLQAASIALAAFVAAVPGVAAAASTTMPPVAATSTMTSSAPMIGISRPAIPPRQRDQSGIDRKFHPDDSKALTPGQLTAAWNAEIDRVFETPVTGGG
jgi:hypothetical protein